MEKRETLTRLRGSLDSNDSFVNRGHRVMKTAGATNHAERMTRVPVWALNGMRIAELVKLRYPDIKNDAGQRLRAARLVRLIQLYYRAGLTSAQVAEQLNMSRNAVKCAIKRLNRSMADPIDRADEGDISLSNK